MSNHPAPTLSEAVRIAAAARWDAGNRSMARAGRTEWTDADWNTAADCTHAVLAALAPSPESTP